MSEQRPLKPQVLARYGEELAQAEKMSKLGFDPKTKKLDESIYGPQSTSFDPVEEMRVLQKNNITDGSFIDAHENGGNLPIMTPPNKIANALDAIQAEDPSFDVSSLEPITPAPAPVMPAMSQPAPAVPVFTEPAPQPVVQPEPQPAAEEPPKEAVEPKEEAVPTDPDALMTYVAKTLKELFGDQAPTEAHLRQWKQIHGNVFVLRIDDRVFLYRYLKRQEWKQILANEAWANLNEEKKEDHIAQRCTLWPAFNSTTQGGLPAGTAPLLAEQIRIHSLFLDPAAVANITIKL